MLEYQRKMMRSLSSAVLGGALLLTLGGCLREDENALVVLGPDSAVVVVPLVRPAFLRPAQGTATANRLELISFDQTPPDAFGRATSEFGYGWRLTNSRPWYIFDLAARNMTTDPRLPALGGLGTEDIEQARAPFGACRLGDGGNFWGGTGGWDFFCFLEGLKPNTDYSALLYRYALNVNGELDVPEMLLNGAVAQPDEFVPLGGSPGGYPTELCDFDPARPTFTVGVTGDQNPLNMGFVTTDANGMLVFDCLVGSGGFWADEFLTDPAEAPMAPNRFESFGLPKYNYIVIFEGTGTPAAPIPSGPMVIRFKVGVDIDQSGNPVGNSFGPLPTSGLNPFQLAEADFAESRPDSIILRLRNLAVLSSSVYQLYALTSGGAVGPLDFRYSNVVPLEAGDSVVIADTLNDGSPRILASIEGGANTHVLKVEHPDDATHIFAAVQSAAGGAPSSVQPLWMEGGIQPPGVVKTKSFGVNFGTFALDGVEQRTWAIGGSASGGLFGDEFRQRYNLLPRPPVGYRYVTWLASGDTLFQRLPDASFTSPPPEYAVLEAADTDMGISDVVQPITILEAFTRICLDQTSGCEGPFDLSGFDRFLLTLEPRAADPSEPGPTVVLEGLIPN